MDDAYRLKLRQWIASVLSVLAITIISLVVGNAMGSLCPSYGDWSTCVGSIGERLIIFAFGFMVIAAWHFADFMQHGRPCGRWLARLAGFQLFYIIMVTLGIMAIMQATGKFTETGWCGEAFILLWQACTRTHPVLSIPILASWLLVLLLCLLKLVVAARSRLTKRQ